MNAARNSDMQGKQMNIYKHKKENTDRIQYNDAARHSFNKVREDRLCTMFYKIRTRFQLLNYNFIAHIIIRRMSNVG